MKFLSSIFKKSRNLIKKSGATVSDQEVFLKQGKEQFKTLIKKGLNIPVTLL